MGLSGLSLLTIADRGWSNKKELRVANVTASWRINAPGKLSATLSTREAWLLGISDFKGKFIRWDHPTLGPWGGVVLETQVSMGRGTLELSAESFVTNMRKKRTRKSYKQVSAPAGSIVFRAFADVAVNNLHYDSIGIDTDGDPISYQWRGDDLFTLVSSVARTSGKSFDVTLADDWSINFQFRNQTGTNRAYNVLLVEGYQIPDGTLTASLVPAFNDILAVSADANDWSKAPSAVALLGSSIQTYGHMQDTRKYYGLSSKQALYTQAKVDLLTIGTPVKPITLRLSDREPQLADFIQGDTIRVWSADANERYLVTIAGRAVDADSGTVTLVGTAVSDE